MRGVCGLLGSVGDWVGDWEEDVNVYASERTALSQSTIWQICQKLRPKETNTTVVKSAIMAISRPRLTTCVGAWGGGSGALKESYIKQTTF